MLRKIFIIILAISLPICAFSADLRFGYTQAQEDLADLGKWTLYSSEIAGGPYVAVFDIPYGGDGVTNYEATVPFLVQDVTEKTYYFVLTASDVIGNESGYSNEVFQRIDVKPPGMPMNLTVEIVIK